MFRCPVFCVLQVSLDRDLDDEELAAAQRVIAPRYPKVCDIVCWCRGTGAHPIRGREFGWFGVSLFFFCLFQEKLEGWWVALGDPKTNALLAIKRVTLNKTHVDVKLEFEAASAGKQKLVLYLICDAYMGCDQVS